MKKIKWIIIALLLILAVYTRFVNLSWGLPYPMHPDERNMAAAVQGLNCKFSPAKGGIQFSKDCLNPHFFAYGQFPLYLGYLVVLVLKFFDGDLNLPIGFQEAVISLRLIAAVASVINVFILIKIIRLFFKDKQMRFLATIGMIAVAIFSPALIQFAHFGTTESSLMLFYSLVIYYLLLFIQKKILNSRFLILNSIVCGLAIAIKVSSVIFLILPVAVLLWRRELFSTIKLILLTSIIAIIFSPFNLIDFNGFMSSMSYETDVALGHYVVFYTRQFVGKLPTIFQLTKIFPYALGWPIFILGILGMLGLPWKKKENNLLRLSLLVYFLPNAFTFAKWTRFMAPIFPIMIAFAVLFLISMNRFIKRKWLLLILILISIIPGVAYLSIYQNPDVRFTASDWIYKDIPANSIILSETANVVDLPIEVKSYKVVSFNFYDLDKSISLQGQLKQYLSTVDYIIVPSRRIFMNHPQEKYPILNEYYQRLFSKKLGFKKIAEFSSYPKITFLGKTVVEFPDEEAEETWSVFDHPVIRIYKRT